MERAIVLLRDTDISVREIAPLVGYANANYFSKVFKRMTGFYYQVVQSNHKLNRQKKRYNIFSSLVVAVKTM